MLQAEPLASVQLAAAVRDVEAVKELCPVCLEDETPIVVGSSMCWCQPCQKCCSDYIDFVVEDLDKTDFQSEWLRCIRNPIKIHCMLCQVIALLECFVSFSGVTRVPGRFVR